MSRRFSSCAVVLLGAVFALSACATQPSASEPRLTPDLAERPVCDSGQVRLDIAFEGGAMGACEVLGPREMNVFVQPENTPINPSPWYAFRLSPQTGGPVWINLHYGEFRHRYRPKVSSDGDDLTYLAESHVSVSDDRTSASIQVLLGTEPVFVTAQELVTSADYDAWLRPYRNRPDLEVSTIGHSIEGRAIEMLRNGEAGDQGTIVLVGRQHPPEITGALAMQAFVDELLGDSALARRFRASFGLAVIPLMNPDGVYHGHWRHNLDATDLNRDWGPFEQPETQAVLGIIDQLAASEATRPVLFLDFHSTNRDVFYTQPVGEDGTAYGFTSLWLERAVSRLPGYEVERAERHQSDLPTAKNYMFGRFSIPAITYELGDNSDREQVSAAARVFAQEMMSILLERTGAEAP